MLNEPKILEFLEKCGISLGEDVSSISGGRNNRIYKIGDEYVLKQYFSHPKDDRNRLEHEYKFLEFAWGQGVKCIPQPINVDYELKIGLYAFVAGKKLKLNEVNQNIVQQAIAFVEDVNKNKSFAITFLPKAADSAFSLTGHLKNIQYRIDKFNSFKPDSEVDFKAEDFIQKVLLPTWEERKKVFLANSEKLEINIDQELNEDEKCLSPSDLGFHNALQKEDGSLVFFDFEYAGWDDPVKLVADFFCQPEIPVKLEFFEEFIAKLSDLFDGESGSLIEKTKLFLPLNRVKWCCILLNDFLQVGNERRTFSEQNDVKERKKVQLEKAIEYLNQETLTTNQH